MARTMGPPKAIRAFDDNAWMDPNADLPFARNKKELRNFERFDDALKGAQTDERDSLSKNINLAASVAMELSSSTGIKHVVRRLCLVSKDPEMKKETSVYAVDSIMRHAQAKQDEVLRLRYEKHLQLHVRNLFKRALRPDSKRASLAQKFYGKIVAKWKEKGWFTNNLDEIVDAIQKSAPEIPQPAILLVKEQKEEQEEAPDVEMQDDSYAVGGMTPGLGGMTPNVHTKQEYGWTPAQGGATAKAGAPPTPIQPSFLHAIPGTPAGYSSQIIRSVPMTPKVEQVLNSAPMTPGASNPILHSVPSTPNPNSILMMVPATPMVGGAAPMTPGMAPTIGGRVPMTPAGQRVPMTPAGAGFAAPSTPGMRVPMTPAGAGMPVPSTPAAALRAVPSTPAGVGLAVPSTPAGAGLAVPSTPAGAGQAMPFTPAAVGQRVPMTPVGQKVPMTPVGQKVPMTPMPGGGMTPGMAAPSTPAHLLPGGSTPGLPVPSTPTAALQGSAAPSTPRGFQPFTPKGPVPATPAGSVQPFTPAGPASGTPASPRPASGTPAIQPFTPATGSSNKPAATTPSPGMPSAVTPGIGPAAGTPGMQPFTPGAQPFTPGSAGAQPFTPRPAAGTPGWQNVTGGHLAPMTPGVAPQPFTPRPAAGTPGWQDVAGGHLAPMTPVGPGGFAAPATPGQPGTPGFVPLPGGEGAPTTPGAPKVVREPPQPGLDAGDEDGLGDVPTTLGASSGTLPLRANTDPYQDPDQPPPSAEMSEVPSATIPTISEPTVRSERSVANVQPSDDLPSFMAGPTDELPPTDVLSSEAPTAGSEAKRRRLTVVG